MAIHRQQEKGGALVSDETLCATRDGRVVPEDDPQANEVIAVAGRPIAAKVAARYSLKASGKAEKAEVAPKAEEPKPAEERIVGAEKSHVLGEDRPSVTKRPLDLHGKGR